MNVIYSKRKILMMMMMKRLKSMRRSMGQEPIDAKRSLLEKEV
jgi:hypothetical protein